MGRKHKIKRKRRPGARNKKRNSKELAYLHTRIDGKETIAISPCLEELKEQDQGEPWVYRISRISAKTGIPFADVREKIEA